MERKKIKEAERREERYRRNKRIKERRDIKVNCTIEQAMKFQRGRRGIDLLFI
jgi:hypothetical protein